MKIPHPIPYQGSKRNLASEILRFFPANIVRLIEPFAGSAAISIASAFCFKADGNFNQSPDKRRSGRTPENMRYDIMNISNLLKGKVTFYSQDYEQLLDMAT
jgi:site-specific DNA-adenine methylase